MTRMDRLPPSLKSWGLKSIRETFSANSRRSNMPRPKAQRARWVLQAILWLQGLWATIKWPLIIMESWSMSEVEVSQCLSPFRRQLQFPRDHHRKKHRKVKEVSTSIEEVKIAAYTQASFLKINQSAWLTKTLEMDSIAKKLWCLTKSVPLNSTMVIIRELIELQKRFLGTRQPLTSVTKRSTRILATYKQWSTVAQFRLLKWQMVCLWEVKVATATTSDPCRLIEWASTHLTLCQLVTQACCTICSPSISNLSNRASYMCLNFQPTWTNIVCFQPPLSQQKQPQPHETW